MKKEKDYRIGQKVIATIKIEDKGQDFIELDVLGNGVLLGNSVMFSHGRLSLLGVGTSNGKPYHTFKEFSAVKKWEISHFYGLLVHMKQTGEKDPLPWKADTLKYKIKGVKKPIKPNRFLK